MSVACWSFNVMSCCSRVYLIFTVSDSWFWAESLSDSSLSCDWEVLWRLLSKGLCWLWRSCLIRAATWRSVLISSAASFVFWARSILVALMSAALWRLPLTAIYSRLMKSTSRSVCDSASLTYVSSNSSIHTLRSWSLSGTYLIWCLAASDLITTLCAFSTLETESCPCTGDISVIGCSTLVSSPARYTTALSRQL